jgi:TonB-dependent starch-binding outer membrane protein SusC
MRYTFLILFLFLLSSMFAQETRIVRGLVTDADNNPLPGVTIRLKNTQTGTTTDFDGRFSIRLVSGELVFSFVGFKDFVAQLSSTDNDLRITLQEDILLLEETVVIGYGVQRKKDLTTAVAVVDEKEFRNKPITSAAQALQGKAAGVQVIQPSGKPGGEMAVRVRGATSVLAGNEPLYVIDGVPSENIKGLNPNDIVSMSVLKDASSAAIYGARAANGVVIISTRRGETNAQPLLQFSTYYGISNLRKNIEVLNTKRYRELMDEIIPGGLDPSQTDFNNWADIVFGTGNTQSHQLSYSQGNEKSSQYVSIGYLSDQGIVKPARFDRYNLRINLDNQIKDWIKLGTTLNLIHMKTKDTPDNASSGRGGVIMSTLNTPPFLNIYKNDGSGQFDPNPFQPSWENPVAYMEGPDQEAIDNQLLGSVFAEATLLKDLKFLSRFGLEYNNYQWDYYLDPFRTNFGRNNNGLGRATKSNAQTVLWENLLTYNLKYENHKLDLLAGSSVQRHKWNQSYIEGSDFPENTSVRTLNAANIITANTWIEEWAVASIFTRMAYDYNNRYYATFSLRRDGSSKLANPWGTNPSFSMGWRVSSESFMKSLTFIDDFKIRGGWGKMGNQDGIPNYSAYGLINYYRRPPTNPLSGPAQVQVTYGNPDLRWETTAQTNLGFDLTMLKNRLNLTIDLYLKQTDDVLLNVQLDNSLPITTIQTNNGNIENKGFEFNINAVPMDKKNFRWIADFNMSFNRNIVTALEYTDMHYFGRIYSNNQDVSIIKVGLPVGSFYGYVSEGVDPETGMIKYKDVNNNGIFDTGDRTVIGNAQPDFILGFTNSFTYKKFDLNVFFQGSYGNDIYNATRIDLEGMFDSKNQSTSVLNRWKQPGDITDIPRAVGNGNVDNVRNSSRFVEDGSYIRLKSITLNYRILENPKWNTIKRLSVYITGYNLLTFTNYSGFDPEVNAYGNSAVEMGIDYGTYPQARTIIVGLNVEF